MTDQEFDQLFDNGESILDTLDLSTAHRINCPTDPMTDLSPAAQTVLDAFLNGYICNPGYNVAFESDRNGLAAALRAAAKQSIFADTKVGRTDEVVLVDTLLAIAAELEGTNG